MTFLNDICSTFKHVFHKVAHKSAAFRLILRLRNKVNFILWHMLYTGYKKLRKINDSIDKSENHLPREPDPERKNRIRKSESEIP